MHDRLSAILLAPDATIRDAMEAIDRGGVEIALAVDADTRLVGVLTDGDVRRALLGGAALSDPVLPFVNRHPHVVSPAAARGDVIDLMRNTGLSEVPVLDDDGNLVGLHLLQELLGSPAQPSMATQIPLAVPHLAGNELRYLRECIETGFVSSVGPFVDRFEREFAEAVGARHAVACASGTAALHVALVLSGVVAGSEVMVPTFTFIASANAVSYIGARPLLVDSEMATWNMDGQLVHDEIARRARAGEALPAAIQVVHVLGHPADMEPLLAVQSEYGVPIVEDAAEALGATYTSGTFAGRSVGTVGAIGCFSFNGNKVMTSGGGGMIVTDDPTVAARAKHLTTQAKLPGHGYVHDEIGFNYRLTNLSAALGVAQLEQLDQFVAAKRRLALRYDGLLSALPVTVPPRAVWADPSFWLYSILLDDDGPSPDEVVAALVGDGIQARPLWPPLHRQPPYLGAATLGGGVAEVIHRHGLSLPSSVALTEAEQTRVVERLAKVLA